jgi:hypothetical protein
MSIKDMWRSNATTLAMLIVLNLAMFTLGTTPWTVLGLICLAGALFLSFRQGMAFGHEACCILQTVARARDPQSPSYGQVDDKVQKRAWSMSTGVKGMLASALAPYVVGCVYIIFSLLKLYPANMVMRLVAWVVALPFWPAMLPFSQTFDRLTAPVVAVLMISPFVLPLCTFAGYMQGPKLWAKSEKAMAEGRRRAKAKSRVGRKKSVPRSQRPEI